MQMNNFYSYFIIESKISLNYDKSVTLEVENLMILDIVLN